MIEYGDGKPKEIGTWDYANGCGPGRDGKGWLHGQETFSLGCFQWVESAKGAPKKGKTTYRVKGNRQTFKEAYDKAEAFCRRKNEMAT